jgi:hypothetical protein
MEVGQRAQNQSARLLGGLLRKSVSREAPAHRLCDVWVHARGLAIGSGWSR